MRHLKKAYHATPYTLNHLQPLDNASINQTNNQTIPKLASIIVVPPNYQQVSLQNPETSTNLTHTSSHILEDSPSTEEDLINFLTDLDVPDISIDQISAISTEELLHWLIDEETPPILPNTKLTPEEHHHPQLSAPSTYNQPQSDILISEDSEILEINIDPDEMSSLHLPDSGKSSPSTD